jgi:hypothetical protein
VISTPPLQRRRATPHHDAARRMLAWLQSGRRNGDAGHSGLLRLEINANVHGRKRGMIYTRRWTVPAAKEKYLVVDVREILASAGSPAGGIFFRAQASLVGTRWV